MAPRKKPRTAAQKRATKKLIAFNKARKALNKKRAAPKRKRKATRTPAQKAATRKLVALNKRRAKGAPRSAAKKRRTKKIIARSFAGRGWIIRAKAKSKGALRTYYFDGKFNALTPSRKNAKIFATSNAASCQGKKLLKYLPSSVTHLEIQQL